MICRGAILGLAAAMAIGHLQGPVLAATEPMGPDSHGSGPNAPLAAPEAGPASAAGPAAAAAGPVARERLLTGNPLWAVPLSSLSATRARPIFSPSRRPPPPAVVAAPYVPPAVRLSKPAEPDHPLLSLMGTVVGESEGVGVFLDQGTKGFLRLKTGQDHQGWILRSVREREATFEKDRLTATLSLPAHGAEQAGLATSSLTVSSLQPAGNAWVDGDGQTISPPGLTTSSLQPAGNAWVDGDGQTISPPPKKTSE
jgi:hypothetical protein